MVSVEIGMEVSIPVLRSGRCLLVYVSKYVCMYVCIYTLTEQVALHVSATVSLHPVPLMTLGAHRHNLQ